MRHLPGLFVSSGRALNRSSIRTQGMWPRNHVSQAKQSPLGVGDKTYKCLCEKLYSGCARIKAGLKWCNDNPGRAGLLLALLVAYVDRVRDAQEFVDECEATLNGFASRHPVTELRMGRQCLSDETKALDALDAKLGAHLRSWWWCFVPPFNILLFIPYSLRYSLEFAQQVNAAHIQFVRDNSVAFEKLEREITDSQLTLSRRWFLSWSGNEYDKRTPWYFFNALCAIHHRREAYRAQSLSTVQSHLKSAEGYYKNPFRRTRYNSFKHKFSPLYVKLDSKKIGFEISKGYLYLQGGGYQQARDVFEDVLKDNDATLSYARIGSAMCLVQEARELNVSDPERVSKLDNALAICENQIQKVRPQKDKRHHMAVKADILLLQGKYDEADVIYDAIQKMLAQGDIGDSEPSKQDVHPDITYHRYIARVKNTNKKTAYQNVSGNTNGAAPYSDEASLKSEAIIASEFYTVAGSQSLFFLEKNRSVARVTEIEGFKVSSVNYWDTTGNNSRDMLFPSLTQSSAGSPLQGSTQSPPTGTSGQQACLYCPIL